MKAWIDRDGCIFADYVQAFALMFLEWMTKILQRFMLMKYRGS